MGAGLRLRGDQAVLRVVDPLQGGCLGRDDRRRGRQRGHRHREEDSGTSEQADRIPWAPPSPVAAQPRTLVATGALPSGILNLAILVP